MRGLSALIMEVTTMASKSIFESKTFWVNALAFSIGFVNLLVAQPFIPPEVSRFFPLVLGLLNVGLRWITGEPVSLSGSK